MKHMKKHPTKPPREMYFHGDDDKEFNLESMRKYARTKPELDKTLETMIAPYVTGAPHILDACCGIGYLAHNLHTSFPRASFLGIDETPYLIKEALALFGSDTNLQFKVGDLYTLKKTYPKAFDISICWKTLSWLPSYEDALDNLLAATRSHIFISSLFYDGDIDFEIRVTEHLKKRSATRHNIYSLPRLTRFLKTRKVRRIASTDFNIDIDLPRGSPDHMGTYTVRLEDGKRLQMSGALPMPWKIVHIEL